MTTKRKKKIPPKPISLLVLEKREIAASEFKARCLEIMDEVERTGAEVVITKHRKPVARLVPAETSTSSFVGSMKGMFWMGDVISPTGELWEGDDSNLI